MLIYTVKIRPHTDCFSLIFLNMEYIIKKKTCVHTNSKLEYGNRNDGRKWTTYHKMSIIYDTLHVIDKIRKIPTIRFCMLLYISNINILFIR